MSTAGDNNNDNVSDICANCGKGEDSSGSLKACAACKLVKYCNRECQTAHRPQHKKECKKRAVELHEEKLFELPPLEYEDCPICLLRMPNLHTGRRYMSCCGKVICSGCIHAVQMRDGGMGLCPFCRTPATSSDKLIRDYEKRMEAGDAIAIHEIGVHYFHGDNSHPQDIRKALEFYKRAGDLGHAESYNNIGVAYFHGQGVGVNMKKAKHYYELAAMGGHDKARNSIGRTEAQLGNSNKALKHWTIASRGGNSRSVVNVKMLYLEGNATKEDYTKAVQSYQAYLREVKSDQRDEAAAAYDDNKYIEEGQEVV